MPNISFDAVPALLRRLGKDFPEAVKRAAVEASHNGIGIVVETIDRTMPHKPVDSGGYRASWASEKTTDGARVYSDAPHAVFIERGTRPHWPPSKPLVLWAVRKFGYDDGPRIAYFVRKKIAEKGTAPRRVAERATPRVGEAFVEAAMRNIRATP